jgi:Phage Mu protein F like protein
MAVDGMRGGGQPSWALDTSAYDVRVNGQRPQQPSVSVPTSMDAPFFNQTGWFDPLAPMRPIAPPDVAGRVFDYNTGYNLSIRPRPYELLTFEQLHALADSYDLLRIVIETRKDQIETENWVIKPRDKTLKKKTAKVPAEMQARIDAITTFFKKPDGENGWKRWIRDLLEDLFITDAPTIYKRRTRSGKVCELVVLDGSKIVRKIDPWGRTPMPYAGPAGKMIYPVAYQHFLKGSPAVDYSVRDIMYRPRNKRARKVYGYSPVEQIVMTVQIALRRQVWQLDYYAEGSIPDALAAVPDSWGTAQIREYQNYFDNLTSGNMAQRRRLKFVPGAMAKGIVQTKEPEQKNDFDEWLARVVCYAFSVAPQWAVKLMNRATAENQSTSSEKEGLEPTKIYVKEIHDELIENEFDSPDLEFEWQEIEDIDPIKNDAILKERTNSGAISLNTWRDQIGLEPDPNPAADRLMVLTSTGLVPIEANTIEGKKEAQDTLGPPVAPGAALGPDGKPVASNSGGEPTDKPPAASVKPGGQNDKGKPGASKAHYHFVKARSEEDALGIPFEHKSVRKAAAALDRIIAPALKSMGIETRKAVDDELGKAKKPADKIADNLDYSTVIDSGDDVAGLLAGFYANTGNRALAQVGVSHEDQQSIFDQVDETAVKEARKHAAELVKGVSDRTRKMVRDIIADGLDENVGRDQIIENLEPLFSPERSELIATTEITRANSAASLIGYKASEKAGVKLKKRWILAADPCPICLENNEAGDIALDDYFPSDDLAPPAHPNCRCAVIPIVQKSGSKK